MCGVLLYTSSDVLTQQVLIGDIDFHSALAPSVVRNSLQSACLGADARVCAFPSAGSFDLRPGTFERWQATVQVKTGEAGELELVPVTAQRLEVPTA